MTYTVNGTYGSGKTECEVIVYEQYNGLRWYVAEGSLNVNATYDEIEEGVDIEELIDVDCCTASTPIYSEDELERFIDEDEDEEEETNMETIIESIINGQRKQALSQLKESDYNFTDLIERLLSDGELDEVTTMFKIAVNNGFIEDNTED